MERSRGRDEGITGSEEAVAAARPDHLEVLGTADSFACLPLHPQAMSTARRPSGPVNVGNVMRLLEWQDYRCALSGRPLTPETASLDHIVPVRDGGRHTIENVQVLHKEVNRAKSTLAHEQFVQLCREVVDHAGTANYQGDAR